MTAVSDMHGFIPCNVHIHTSSNLEKAIYYMVQTYLTSEIVTRSQAAEILERVRAQIIERK